MHCHFVSYEFQHKKPPEKIAFFSLRISSEIPTWKSGAPSLTRNIDIIDYSSILDFWPRLFIYTQELFDKEWYLPKSSSDLPILHLSVPTDKTWFQDPQLTPPHEIKCGSVLFCRNQRKSPFQYVSFKTLIRILLLPRCWSICRNVWAHLHWKDTPPMCNVNCKMYFPHLFFVHIATRGKHLMKINKYK